jgi:hypothetical protein
MTVIALPWFVLVSAGSQAPDGSGPGRRVRRFAAGPEDAARAREPVRLVRRAVDEELTPRQRALLLAVVVEGVPLDTVVDELGTTRGAVYKTTRGVNPAVPRRERVPRPEGRPAVSGSGGLTGLERLLDVDPRDAGCDHARHVLHVYAELVQQADDSGAARYLKSPRTSPDAGRASRTSRAYSSCSSARSKGYVCP